MNKDYDRVPVERQAATHGTLTAQMRHMAAYPLEL